MKTDRLRIGWICILGCLSLTSALGQNRNTPQVRFKDGVYLTLQQLQTNQPGYSWKQLRGNWFRNPESGVVTVVELIAAENAALSPESLWGVCVDGKPAVRIDADSINRSSVVFYPLTITGAISYFSYEGILRDTVEMAAFNPESGLPFRKGKVQRSRQEPRERLLLWQTGEILPFTRENLLRWTDNDPEIRRAISVLQEGEPNFREQLLRAIVVYNQRNPLPVVK
ncbi:MAG: hypothetical protein KBG02_16850 [Haliscomenobacter sp.]|nr:hypothetical protein [Haliscomenobacter sp.]